MNKFLTVIVVLLLLGFSQTSYVKATEYINPENLYVYSNDGSVFLGSLSTNTFNTYSVFNTYGAYGSKYSTTSIWNSYGTYGSKYSSYSATNRYTSTPPILVYNGKVMGYVTANPYLSNGISPQNLWTLARSL